MKRPKPPSLVTMVVLTTITVIFWVFFSVYRAFTQQPTPTVPAEILEPFSPDLDEEALSKLQGRIFFAEGTLPTINILTTTPSALPSEELETATPSPTTTPTATPTATLSPTPSSTPSAEVTP